jgi:transposase
MSKIRRNFSKDFKTKVVLEALKERNTLKSLAKKYELQPTQISKWKAEALSNFGNVFSAENNAAEKKKKADLQMLYAQIGEQK